MGIQVVEKATNPDARYSEIRVRLGASANSDEPGVKYCENPIDISLDRSHNVVARALYEGL